MKQIIQDLKKGKTILEEVPSPTVKPGRVLIKSTRSLVSLGTEKMLVDFGRANIFQKARQQPEKVKMVLDKIKTDGFLPTINAVKNKLDKPIPLGYCNVGKVVAIGEGVSEFSLGDRVASNGYHAEYVCVPKNLVAKIPNNVTDDEASFAVIGSIGLQGIRLLEPTFGETIVVIGLGLIGIITCELLIANGCEVIGFDVDQEKIKTAKKKGINALNSNEDLNQVKLIESITNGNGADGVIITASNKSNEIISMSAKMCRKRGRIVLIGVIGLDINRADFYEKEISFQVSCSYGPGRYDEKYEQEGHDYPIGYVRWTQKRNINAVLNAISNKLIEVNSLITEKVPLNDYSKIYDNLLSSKSIASIIKYDSPTTKNKNLLKVNDISYKGNNGILGIIGSGNFTSSTILPTLKKCKANIKYIASSGGVSSTLLAKKFKISNSTTDYNQILKDNEVDLVFITTKHNMHAKMTIESINAGKNVFVEKPLALNENELNQIIKNYKSNNSNISVGFNRRFSPLAKKMKSILGKSSIPMNIVATMNAGYIPQEVWVHDLKVGGGRIVGEACHFIDLCTYLTSSKVVSVCMSAMDKNPKENTDNASILLKYENGSNAVINYFSNGNKAYSKERVEVFTQDRTLILDNWRKLKGYGFKGFSSAKSIQDKGHFNQFKELLNRQISGGKSIIPFDEIINTTKASFAAITSLKEGKWVYLK